MVSHEVNRPLTITAVFTAYQWSIVCSAPRRVESLWETARKSRQTLWLVGLKVARRCHMSTIERRVTIVGGLLLLPGLDQCVLRGTLVA